MLSKITIILVFWLLRLEFATLARHIIYLIKTLFCIIFANLMQKTDVRKRKKGYF